MSLDTFLNLPILCYLSRTQWETGPAQHSGLLMVMESDSTQEGQLWKCVCFIVAGVIISFAMPAVRRTWLQLVLLFQPHSGRTELQFGGLVHSGWHAMWTCWKMMPDNQKEECEKSVGCSPPAWSSRSHYLARFSQGCGPCQPVGFLCSQKSREMKGLFRFSLRWKQTIVAGLKAIEMARVIGWSAGCRESWHGFQERED